MVLHSKYPLFIQPKHLQSSKLLRPAVKDEILLHESKLFFSLILTLGHGQSQNVSQYSLHYMTHAPGTFGVAMSDG